MHLNNIIHDYNCHQVNPTIWMITQFSTHNIYRQLRVKTSYLYFVECSFWRDKKQMDNPSHFNNMFDLDKNALLTDFNSSICIKF